MIGKNKIEGYHYYFCAGRSLARHLRDCDERFINARTLESLTWDGIARVLTDPDELAKSLDALEHDAAQTLQPKRERLATASAEAGRLQSRIARTVAMYDDADDVELAMLREKVKSQTAQLKALQVDLARLTAELEQGTPSAVERTDIIAAAEIYAEIIPTADFETRRYVLDRFRFICRLSREHDGELRANLSLQLRGSGSENSLGAIATTAPRSVESNRHPLLSTSIRILSV